LCLAPARAIVPAMIAVIGALELVVLIALLVVVSLLARRAGRWTLVFLAGLLALLALTNPGEEDHRTAVFNQIQARLDPLARVAASALPTRELLPLQYHNYVLASVCTVDGKRVSIGFLKNVLVGEFDQPRR